VKLALCGSSWFWVMAVLLWGTSSARAAPHLPKKWDMRFSPGTQKVVTIPVP
jgi:hypothetical protein